jgi:hypothetical protein
MGSQQQLDQERRAIEEKLGEAKAIHEAKLKAFETLRESWQRQVSTVDSERLKTEERISGFSTFVENAKGAGQHVDDERVSKHTTALQANLKSVLENLQGVLNAADAELKPHLEELAKARRTVIGLQEYLAALSAEEVHSNG